MKGCTLLCERKEGEFPMWETIESGGLKESGGRIGHLPTKQESGTMVDRVRQCRREGGGLFLVLSAVLYLMVLSGCSTHQMSDRRLTLNSPPQQASIDAIEQSRIQQDPVLKKATAAYHFGLACLYWEAQDLERTLDHFKQALEYDPDSAYMNFTIGSFFRNLAAYENDPEIRHGALQRAEYYFENAYVVDPQDPEILIALAEVSSQLGKPAVAVSLFQLVLKQDPDNLDVSFNLAAELTMLRNYRESIEIINVLLQKEPDNPRANAIMGYNFYHLQQDEQAITHFERAYQANAYDSSLVMHLGSLYEKTRQYDKAVEIYRRICQVSPKDSPFYRNYVRTLLILSKFDLAEKVIQEIMAADVEDFLWHFYLGLILQERNDCAAAISHLQRARELGPDDPRPVLELSLCYLRLDDRVNMIGVIETALAAHPGNPVLYSYLGQAHVRLENFEKAIEAFKQGLSLNPADGTILLQLAGVLERVQRIEEAEQVLLRLIEIDPDSGEALNFLGYLYAEQNMKLDEAEKYLERALTLEPDNSAFIDSMGWIYYRQQRYERAHDWLLRASKAMEHSDPVVLEHLADVLVQLGCYSLAITTLERARTITPDNEKVTKKIEEINGKEDAAGARCLETADYFTVSEQPALPFPADGKEE